jgi:hypothetical protein
LNIIDAERGAVAIPEIELGRVTVQMPLAAMLLGPVGKLSNRLRLATVSGPRASRPHAGGTPAVQTVQLFPNKPLDGDHSALEHAGP